jgi:uncharacterized protein (TIGR02646 family)
VKHCQKSPEPPTLTTYRQAVPAGKWEQLRDDPLNDGQQAYHDIKQTLVRTQRCLCAFCEMRLADDTNSAALEARKNEQRVEHFHPKNDRVGHVNWALHWPNLWAVCLGGSYRPPQGANDYSSRYLLPLPDNLSCDAFKDIQISSGKLPAAVEGWILAPDEVPPFPLLFSYSPNGAPEPHANCSAVTLSPNQYADTAMLVAKTIEHLNLGNARLSRNRTIAKAQLEKRIAEARKESHGAPPERVLLNLARRLFAQDSDKPWPEYFTLIRWRLDEAAEAHLRAIQFQG